MKTKCSVFLRLSVALVSSSAMLGCNASDTGIEPNVLPIMTDDQGYRDLSIPTNAAHAPFWAPER